MSDKLEVSEGHVMRLQYDNLPEDSKEKRNLEWWSYEYIEKIISLIFFFSVHIILFFYKNTYTVF